jgi:hypothetical protein
LLITLVAGLAFASAADAAIVPQRSIAGVRLGMTQAQVKRVMRAPQRVQRGRNTFGRFVVFQYSGLRVFFQGGRTVTSISTTRRSERTARGVGVGSSEAIVKRRVAGVHCTGSAAVRLCEVGVARPGHRVTTFFLRSGRVFSVSVAVVVD